MGRVNWRTQTHLIYWVSQRVGGWKPLREDELPIVIGCPPWCREFSCMKRFKGKMAQSELQEFIADDLLDLPPIPIVTLGEIPIASSLLPHLSFSSSGYNKPVHALIYFFLPSPSHYLRWPQSFTGLFPLEHPLVQGPSPGVWQERRSWLLAL